MDKPLERLIIETDVGGDAAGGFQRLGIHDEAVVLRGDFDAPRGEVFHGVVCPAVAELQFESLRAKSQSQKLVSETNPENRDFSNQTPEHFDAV